MRTNTNEAENRVKNENKGTQNCCVHFSHPLFPSPTTNPVSRDKRDQAHRAERDSLAYWKTKVRPRVIRGAPTPELYARFNLNPSVERAS